jgi:hypothetical protein
MYIYVYIIYIYREREGESKRERERLRPYADGTFCAILIEGMPVQIIANLTTATMHRAKSKDKTTRPHKHARCDVSAIYIVREETTSVHHAKGKEAPKHACCVEQIPVQIIGNCLQQNNTPGKRQRPIVQATKYAWCTE